VNDYLRRREQQEKRDLVRKVPFRGPWPNRGKSWCVWCGDRIIIPDGKKGAGGPNMRAQWHPECVHDYNLHSRLETQFRHIEERDGLKCAWPDCGSAPERWHSPRIDVGYSEGPEMPWTGRRAGKRYWDALFAFRREHWHRVVYWDVDRRTALQLDHRVPLWSVAHLPDDERRRYFGPDNLWLLCPEHHKAKTREEAAQRAQARKLAA
jgi:hypothetical protein